MRCSNCGWTNQPEILICEKCESSLSSNPAATINEWGRKTQVFQVRQARTLMLTIQSLNQSYIEKKVNSSTTVIHNPAINTRQAEASRKSVIAVKVCLQCGYSVPFNANVCFKCGHDHFSSLGWSKKYNSVVVKPCINCNHKNDPDADVCIECGAVLFKGNITLEKRRQRIKTKQSHWVNRVKRVFKGPFTSNISVMICPLCQTVNLISANFCKSCGLALKGQEQPPIDVIGYRIQPYKSIKSSDGAIADPQPSKPRSTRMPDMVEMKPGDEINGYQIEGFLAEGAFAKVFKVRDLFDDSSYAMKVLKLYQFQSNREREEMCIRFEREFKVGQWRSPYLINTYDRGEIGKNPYHIQELMMDGSLSQYIRSEQPFDFIHKTLLDVLHGLQFLHSKQVVHRDLKPQNVLANGETHKLADFGIDYFINARNATYQINERNAYGTLPYLAPEAYNSKFLQNPYTFAADLFSFGVMAFELITGGTLPFGNVFTPEDFEAYKFNAREGRYHFLSYYRKDLPEGWEPLMDQLLEPELDKRLHDVTTVIARIEDITKGSNGDKRSHKSGDLRYKFDIFLSYAEEDIKFAQIVYNALTVRGLKVFFSKETLSNFIGESFHDKIEEALMESQHFILLCSEISMRKEWVKTEFQTFHSECYMKQPQHRRLIPLPCHGFDKNTLPPLLRRFQSAKKPEEVIEILQKTN